MYLQFLRSVYPFFAGILFCVWWGGLIFYSAIVVPIGGNVIGVTEQGAITANVTFWLNILGTMTTIVLFSFLSLPTLLGRKKKEVFLRLESVDKKQSAQVKWGVAIALAVAQLLLWILSFTLYEEFDSENMLFHDRERFYLYHRFYLWGTIIQMCCGLWWLGLVARLFPDDSGKGL